MQQQENQNIEYKEIWRDECLKWICGFANKVDILYHDMLEGSLITTADKIVDLIFLKYLKAKITLET